MKTSLLRLALLAAALALCAAPARAAEPDWPDQLRIGTASPGGTYYVYGEALAKILTRTLDLPVERLATEGPVQNIELMEAGEVKLGFVTIGVALQAWNGTGVWAGKKPARSMRVIFPIYDTPFQLLMFASLTAHTSAMMPVMLAVGLGIPGVPADKLAFALALTTGIMGVTTPHPTGPACWHGSQHCRAASYTVAGKAE
jgi:hypothetical protein